MVIFVQFVSTIFIEFAYKGEIWDILGIFGDGHFFIILVNNFGHICI